MARAPAGERKQGEYRRQVEVLALVLQAFRTPQGGQAPAINDSDIINASLVDYKAHILVTTVYRTSVTVDKARQVIHANAELLQQEKPPFYVNLTEAIKDGMSKSEICSGIKRQDYWNNLRGGLKLRGRDFEIDANVNHQAVQFLRALEIEGANPAMHAEQGEPGPSNGQSSSSIPTCSPSSISMTDCLRATKANENDLVKSYCPSLGCNFKASNFAEALYHWLKSCKVIKTDYLWCGFCCQFLLRPPVRKGQLATQMTSSQRKKVEAPYVAHARECSSRWAGNEGWTTALGAGLEYHVPRSRKNPKTEAEMEKMEQRYIKERGARPCCYSVPNFFLDIVEKKLVGPSALDSSSLKRKTLPEGVNETVIYHFCPDCTTACDIEARAFCIHRRANGLAQHYQDHLLRRVTLQGNSHTRALVLDPYYPTWKCTYPRCDFEAADVVQRVNHLSVEHGIPLLVDYRGLPHPGEQVEEGHELKKWSVERMEQPCSELFLTLGLQEMRKKGKVTAWEGLESDVGEDEGEDSE